MKNVVLNGDTLIGRSPECQLKVVSTRVSRKHCLLRLVEAGVLLRDLNSANGTLVNGKPIPPELDILLPPGVTVTVGPLNFQVQYTLIPEAPPVATPAVVQPVPLVVAPPLPEQTAAQTAATIASDWEGDTIVPEEEGLPEFDFATPAVNPAVPTTTAKTTESPKKRGFFEMIGFGKKKEASAPKDELVSPVVAPLPVVVENPSPAPEAPVVALSEPFVVEETAIEFSEEEAEPESPDEDGTNGDDDLNSFFKQFK